MSGKLEGKIAVVTGGTSGIGLAAAKRFIAEGAHVYVTGRRQKELDEAVKELGPKSTGVRGDIAELADLDKLYAAVQKAHGHIDVLFANAAVWNPAPFDQITPEAFDTVFDVNTRGTFFTVQKALPLLGKGASVILTGTIAGQKGMDGMAVYGASKAALRVFVRVWTSELRARGVRFNLLSPGPVFTPIFESMPQAVIDGLSAQIPLGRMGKAEEIANVALFLASSEASFVSGAEITADGGMAQI